MSDEQIAANQLQIDSSLEAINRIAQTTTFQGRGLLDGSLDFITTAGSLTNLADLQIDQANLGATGQMNVNVEISAAAVQAEIKTASGDAQASTTLKLGTGKQYAAGDVVTGKISILKAKSLSPEYEGAKMEMVNLGVAGSAEAVSWDAENKKLTISVYDDSTYADIKTQLADVGFELIGEDGVALLDADALEGSLAENSLLTDSLTIEAKNAGEAYNGVQVSFVKTAAVAAGAADIQWFADSKRLVINVNDVTDTELSVIETAFTTDADVKDSVHGHAERRHADSVHARHGRRPCGGQYAGHGVRAFGLLRGGQCHGDPELRGQCHGPAEHGRRGGIPHRHPCHHARSGPPQRASRLRAPCHRHHQGQRVRGVRRVGQDSHRSLLRWGSLRDQLRR